MPRIIVNFALITYILCFCSAVQAKHTAREVNQKLQTIDNSAQQAYRQALTATWQRQDPLIVCLGTDIILYHHHQRSSISLLPDAIANLKAVSHIPLGVYNLLVASNNFPQNKADVAAFYQQIKLASPFLVRANLSHEQLLRARDIIQASLAVLRKSMDNNHVNNEYLAKYFKHVRPLLRDNLAELEHRQLDLMTHQVMLWQKQISPAEWQNLIVVVAGSDLARSSSLYFQYFAKLLHPTLANPRLLYAEGSLTETSALNYVGAWYLSRQISQTVFEKSSYLTDIYLTP